MGLKALAQYHSRLQSGTLLFPEGLIQCRSCLLALIHTSQVFLSVETLMKQMFVEIMPEVRLISILDDSLLPDVLTTMSISNNVTKRLCLYVLAAEAAGVDAVLSLCSSVGPAIDVA